MCPKYGLNKFIFIIIVQCFYFTVIFSSLHTSVWNTQLRSVIDIIQCRVGFWHDAPCLVWKGYVWAPSKGMFSISSWRAWHAGVLILSVLQSSWNTYTKTKMNCFMRKLLYHSMVIHNQLLVSQCAKVQMLLLQSVPVASTAWKLHNGAKTRSYCLFLLWVEIIQNF